LVFFLSSLSVLFLYLFLKFSWTGKAIRAVSMDSVGAQLCGIDPKRVYALSTGLATGLALFSGSFYAMLQGFTPFDSEGLTIKAFLVCVISGLGSVSGLIFGSFLLSILEVFSGFYMGEEWKNVLSLLLLILFLAVRPRGLFGIKYHEKA
ncbi:MAG: branched-chain amino acid ABC transporter permease, partial [Aquificaceae bacterium]